MKEMCAVVGYQKSYKFRNFKKLILDYTYVGMFQSDAVDTSSKKIGVKFLKA